MIIRTVPGIQWLSVLGQSVCGDINSIDAACISCSAEETCARQTFLLAATLPLANDVLYCGNFARNNMYWPYRWRLFLAYTAKFNVE